MFLRYYLLIMLPMKAIIAQTVVMSSLLGFFNPSQIVNVFFIIFNIVFIMIYLHEITCNRFFMPLFVSILLLIFLSVFQPVFSFVFTRSLKDFAAFLKLLNWITVIPIAFVAFKTIYDIRQLWYSALWAFAIIVIGLIIGNIYEINYTAYRFGIFHIGFWFAEGPLSLAVLTFLPFFFLPCGNYHDAKPFDYRTICLSAVAFCLLLLIMKRSSILAFIICIFVILFCFAKNSHIKFSMKRFFCMSAAFISFLFLSFSFLWATHPDAIQRRFSDVEKYEKSGDVSTLGSGRFALADKYLSLYVNRPLIQQLIGVDLAGYVDKNKGGYLYTSIKKVPHNDYLEFLMRNGILGLIAFLWFLLISFYRTWKVFRFSIDPLSAQLSSVMLGMFALYLLNSIAGMISNIFPMTLIAMLLGATLGVDSHETSFLSGTVSGEAMNKSCYKE